MSVREKKQQQRRRRETGATWLRQPNTDGFLHLHCPDFHIRPPQTQRRPSQQSANLTLAFGTQKSPQRAHQLRLHTLSHQPPLGSHSTTPTPTRTSSPTCPTRDFLKLFLRQAERHADILATILARTSARMSVSVSWIASFNTLN